MRLVIRRVTRWLPRWWQRIFGQAPAPTDQQRALDLLKAIDAGGLPLNPARVNDIARQLGLEVSPKAPMVDTIARIRACTQRWH